MEPGGEFNRRAVVIAAAVMALGLPLAPRASGQEPLGFLPPLIAFLSATTGADLEAQLTREPGAGAMVTDPAGDYEHITGEAPRLITDYLDIREGAIYTLITSIPEMFAPTNTAVLWAPTGPLEVEPPNADPFNTYTTNIPKDGTQYEDGALLFTIGLRAGPPSDPTAVCDYTVWAHDSSRGATFQNLPEFPRDPAAGANLAFGVRLFPQGGGVPVAFALGLDDQGVFQPTDTDVRALVIEETIGLLVPRQRVGDLAAANWHAVCSQGSAIDPTSSGADQTGLVPITLAEAGALEITETPITATPTTAPTTTGSVSATKAPVADSVADGSSGAAVWAPAIAAAALLGAVGYWVFSRRRNPEERALAAWRKAERALALAEEEAEPLVVVCVDTRSRLEELNHERVDLCRVWPPACLDEADGEADSPARDQHFRRMALGELWLDYKEGRIGAEQVEARWREVNTPAFQARMRDTNEAYRETLSKLDNEIAAARSEVERLCPPAANAEAKVETAGQAVIDARTAYLGTLETAPLPPAASWLLERCEEMGATRLVADGPTEHLRVNVGFMISIGRFVGRERNLERGERLILELESLIHELNEIAEVNRAREGALHIGSAGHEYHPGVYWVTAGGILRGETAEGLPPEGEGHRPSGAVGPEANLTDLPGVIGDHSGSKVVGWMTGFDTLTMQRTFFHQLVTSRPFVVWECRDRGWARRERVWRVEVGQPLRNQGEIRWFSAESPGRRAQFETEINRLAWVATGVVTRDLRRLLRWRASHAPETSP